MKWPLRHRSLSRRQRRASRPHIAIMSLPPLGAPAPDFILPGAEGELIRLSDYQDRAHVVLVFYPFDFSPICSVQLPGLQAQAQRFAALDAVVLGISTDSPHSHRAFAAELGLEFPLLSDFFGKMVSETYGVLRPEATASAPPLSSTNRRPAPRRDARIGQGARCAGAAAHIGGLNHYHD